MKKSLGCNLEEIYENWKKLDAGPGRRIVGWCSGLGTYDFYHNELCFIFRTSSGVSSYRRVTRKEKKAVDSALSLGIFQIEARPISGIFKGQGGQGTLAEINSTIVYHQATGKPL